MLIEIRRILTKPSGLPLTLSRNLCVRRSAMLVGHYAAGFIGKMGAGRVPLATLMTAAMLPDLLTFVFQLVGIEHAGLTPGFPRYFGLNAYDQAISHSLAMDAIWAIVFAVAFLAWRSDGRGAFILALAVLSHWFFDALTHGPDMPLAPGITRTVGLALWNSVPGTLIIEGGLWIAGIFVYARTTQPTTKAGSYALWLLAVPLTLWFVVTPFSPQPAGDFSHAGITIFVTIHIVFVALASVIDRHRMPRMSRLDRLAAQTS